MNYKITLDGNMAIIRLLKDFTIFYNTDLIEELKQYLDKGAQCFVFDMTKAENIDSMGIGCILNAGKLTEKYSQKAIIVNYTQQVKYAVDLLGLDHWIEFKNNEREVLRQGK